MFLFSLCAGSLYGQTLTDTLKLHEIHIEATRISEPRVYQPVFINVIDSTRLQLYNADNLGELLSDQSGVFIRQDGPGGLSTISIRGFDASQTQVIWEGMELNHPMLGVTDLSLIPVSMFSSIQIAPGNASTVFGSGSSGGTIFLSSGPKPGNSVTSSVSAGSFGQNSQSVTANMQKGPWYLNATVGRMGAANNFSYFNSLTGRQEKRKNNAEQVRQMMVNTGWKKGILSIKSGFWFNLVNNDISPSITQYDYSARQHDRSDRWYLHMQVDKGLTNYSFRSYYSFYNLRYVDPVVAIDSRSHSIMFGTEGSLIHYFNNNLNIGGGFMVQRDIIHTNNYSNGARRWSKTIYLHGEYDPASRFRIYPALRYDTYSDFGSRLSPSLGFNYTVRDDVLYARAEVKRDFTIPTFNELYWAVGGNPNLKAEASQTAEAGFTYRLYPGSHMSLEISPTLYNSSQHNGIRWIPQSNGISTPVNILDLHMTGLEFTTMLKFHWVQWRIIVRNTFNRTHAVVTKDRQNNQDIIGKQIRYVPEWTSKTGLYLRNGPFLLYADNQWVGARYTTSDHSSPIDPLKAYSVWDIGASAHLTAGPLDISLNGACRNVFNNNYQVIAWYPMPGRNYTTELTIKLPL